MAVINQTSLELSLSRSSRDSYRNYPAEDYGKLRSAYCQLGTVPGALYTTTSPPLAMQASDAGGTIDLLHLPFNRLRLLPYLSVVRTSLASGTLQIGIRQYTTQPRNNIVAQTADVFTNGAGGIALSSAAAAAPVAAGTLMDFNVWAYKGITLFATLSGAVTANDWLEFRPFFIAE